MIIINAETVVLSNMFVMYYCDILYYSKLWGEIFFKRKKGN